MDAETVSKSAFASIIGRTPARVSQYIAEGKLTPPAVRADGTIDVGLGKQQLRSVLDPTQQLGLTNHEPLIDDDDPALAKVLADGKASSVVATRRYLELKADEKAIDVEGKRRRAAADAGRWLETDDATATFNKKIGTIFTDLDAWVLTCGEQLAVELNVDARAATIVVRKSLAAFRDRQANVLEAAAAVMPELQAAE